MENLQEGLWEAYTGERDLRVRLSEYENNLGSEPGFSSFPKEADLVCQEIDAHYPWKELEVAKAESPSSPKLRSFIKTEVEYGNNGDTAEPNVTTRYPVMRPSCKIAREIE